MKRFLWLLLLLCPYVIIAQTKALSIGDRVPDVQLKNLMNAPHAMAGLYKFKSKIVLLDFWATTCGACIGELKMLDSLQTIYQKDLSVLAINSLNDSKEKVDKLMKRLQLKVTVPMELGNKQLQALFPHEYVPHFVWLDSNFTILAITGGEEVTAARIAGYLSGNGLGLTLADQVKTLDASKPLFQNANGGEGQQLFARSTMAGYVPGLPSGNFPQIDQSRCVTKLLYTNQSAAELIMRAWQYFPENPIIKWEGQPSNTYYTYELITPPVDMQKAMQLLREDIERYLHLTAEITNQPEPELIIHQLPN